MKIQVDREAIDRIAVRHLGEKPSAVDELTDGWFNTAYRIELPDGSKAVLKIAPKDDWPILRYEKGIMRSEVEVMRTLGKNY